MVLSNENGLEKQQKAFVESAAGGPCSTTKRNKFIEMALSSEKSPEKRQKAFVGNAAEGQLSVLSSYRERPENEDDPRTVTDSGASQSIYNN